MQNIKRVGFHYKKTELTKKNALQNEENIQLIGFGTFNLRKLDTREGRNLQTENSIGVPASKVPAFKTGKALKNAVKTE